MKTTTTAGYKTIAERTVGYRTVMGTDWPITDSVRIFRPAIGRPTWIVTLGLCDGISLSTREFRTRREALAYYGEDLVK